MRAELVGSFPVGPVFRKICCGFSEPGSSTRSPKSGTICRTDAVIRRYAEGYFILSRYRTAARFPASGYRNRFASQIRTGFATIKAVPAATRPEDIPEEASVCPDRGVQGN